MKHISNVTRYWNVFLACLWDDLTKPNQGARYSNGVRIRVHDYDRTSMSVCMEIKVYGDSVRWIRGSTSELKVGAALLQNSPVRCGPIQIWPDGPLRRCRAAKRILVNNMALSNKNQISVSIGCADGRHEVKKPSECVRKLVCSE